MALTKILLNGAFGRMGQCVEALLRERPEFQLLAKTGKQDNLDAVIKDTKPDIVIDFTHAHCVWDNVQIILKHPVHAIIGTSGLKKEQIEVIIEQSKNMKRGGVIVPNFSLGAVLQMRCAKQIARYFVASEIVETHHAEKIDAPSSTAYLTAEKIKEARNASQSCNVPIHSIRLPGFKAEQEVIFSSAVETVSVTHRVFDREAYMPGLLLACQKVQTLDHIHYGLDVFLEE